MKSKITVDSITAKVVLFSLCLVILIGCGDSDDGNDWVGKWQLESVKSAESSNGLGNLAGDLATLLLGLFGDLQVTYRNDGTWLMEHDLGSVSGTYSLSESSYTIKTTSEGTTEVETGTWSRKGNTLVQTSSDGAIITWKKI